MSLRPRLHVPPSPSPPQPDTPSTHYSDPLEEEGSRVHRHARNESLPGTPLNGRGSGSGSAASDDGYDKLQKKTRFVPGQKAWLVITAVLGLVLFAKLITSGLAWADTVG